jgi:hypothetical protein
VFLNVFQVEVETSAITSLGLVESFLKPYFIISWTSLIQ